MGTLPLDYQTIDIISKRIIDALTRLGYTYTRRDGLNQQVKLRRRLVTENGGILLFEVDTERLPRGVRADQLTNDRTLHHLTAVVHHPVRVLNTTGITYAVLVGHRSGQAKLPPCRQLSAVLCLHEGSPYIFPVGEGPEGPVWSELAGHYLVGGETGSGKTTWLLSTASALASLNPPQALQLAVVDPKGIDFLPLAQFPHLARPIATTVDEAGDLAAWLVDQVDNRRRKFLSTLSRDLDTHNARSGESLPRILTMIDEVTTLALRAGLKSPFYKHLIHLTSVGRAFGLHLILATQNPKAEVLNTLIRGNLAVRIAFRVTTSQHSQVILGTAGAEKLAQVPGRMLARLGDGRLRELQGYQVGEDILASLAIAGREELTGQIPAYAGTLLDAETQDMIAYAKAHLGGRFPQDELMAAGWSRRTYRRAVDKLKRANLLQHGENNALHLTVCK